MAETARFEAIRIGYSLTAVWAFAAGAQTKPPDRPTEPHFSLTIPITDLVVKKCLRDEGS